MNLAAVMIPPPLDAKQALRLRRFGLAALSYALAAVLVAVAWRFGVLPAATALEVTAACLAVNLGLYLAIRSEFNLRFEDPSLTRFQILAGITVLMYIVYHMDDGRNIALFACFIAFLFGIFRLNVREFTLVALYTLAAYALVINLLMHLRPQAIHDVHAEWMSWLGLAGFLPCFTIIGGQINTLRRKLRESEARFRLTFEFAGSGIAHVDMDGRFLRVNRSLCEIFGYSGTELVGRTVKGLSHPEDRDKSDAARARVLSGEVESTRLQKRYLRKDGATVWVDLTVALVRDAAGKPLYEIAVFDDDTERKNAESALRESEARFRSLTEMSSDFYWKSDAEHRLTKRGSADKTLSSVSIFRQGAQIGQRRWEIPYLSPDEAGWRAHRAALDAHRPFRDFELSRLGADGTERHISISGDPVFDDFGAFTGFRGVGTDITERKRTEQALRNGAEKLRLFADNVPAMTVLWDENLRCRFASKVFAEFYGLAVDDIVGKHMREILGEEVFRETEGHAVQVLQGYPVTFQRTRKLRNGESRYLEIKLLPHIGDQGKILGCFDVTTDITERKLEDERIQRVAHHDSLTGLPNRLLFNDRLNQAMNLAKRESRQFALLYLDLDKFKPVNDTLGHTAGDELLRVVATRIRHQVRESDTVARVGGDEFTVILPDIARREEAEIVARKIIDALAMPFELGGQKQSADIGTSIGIAVYPADARDADALVRAADAAMYSAKQAGNSFCFYAVA